VKNTTSGFTLIEVLLVTIMLAFLALSTFSAVHATLQAKEDIDNKTEMLQGSRSVFSIMERDFRLAFYVKDEDLGYKPRQASGATPLDPPARPAKLPVTLFKGESAYVFFSSASHQRLSADSPENEQNFVTYQLSSGELVRAESPHLVSFKDREDPNNYHSFKLLTQVKSLKFEFYDPRSEKWSDGWDTEKADYKDRLPAAVRINVEYMPEVEEGSRRKVEAQKIVTSFAITQNDFKPGLAPAVVVPKQ